MNQEKQSFKCLVFDTETTGKIENIKNEDGTTSTIIPRLIQLGYVVYDTRNPKEAKIFDQLIDITDDIVIQPGAEAVHKISKEMIASASSDKKMSIESAIDNFMKDVESCDYIVAHNIMFDKNVLTNEINLLAEGQLKTNSLTFFETFDDKNWICTMKPNINVCKMETPKQSEWNKKLQNQGREPKYFKFPKLSETYNFYFGYDPIGDALHNAIIDVILCLRVFVRYMTGEDICGQNSIITNYIKEITPKEFLTSDGEFASGKCPLITDKSIILDSKNGGKTIKKKNKNIRIKYGKKKKSKKIKKSKKKQTKKNKNRNKKSHKKRKYSKKS